MKTAAWSEIGRRRFCRRLFLSLFGKSRNSESSSFMACLPTVVPGWVIQPERVLGASLSTEVGDADNGHRYQRGLRDVQGSGSAC